MVRVKPILYLVFAFLIYHMMMQNSSDVINTFVPSNAYEVPKNLSDKDWQKLNDKFGTLIQVVNSTTYDVSYQLDNLLDAFLTILNSSGQGKFVILSVGTKQDQFTLYDVLVQDISTLAVTKFSRVDFIVQSLNPFRIHRVVITPETKFLSSQKVVPRDVLRPKEFRILNPLHLFNPFATSDTFSAITSDDKAMFEQTLREKAVTLQSLAPGNPNGTNTNNPVPSDLSGQIVGAGPLHPVGL
jgi:hypothetical protein